MRIKRMMASALAFLAITAMTCVASASLSSFYQFNGKGNWSIDAVGSNSSPVGSLMVDVPAGSTVERAILYSSRWGSPSFIAPDVTLGGTNYSGAAWTFLGATPFPVGAWRADVTAQVKAAVGGGGVPLLLPVTENAFNSNTDGEVLVVIYSNPAEKERTIAVLDGFSAPAGDSFTLNFASPLTGVGNPGFEALMSLGIGFGFQPSSQFSIVDGDGRRLSSSAGGQDDGGPFNGGLITAGGLGDSTANPHPFLTGSSGNIDDELYDLAQGNVVDPTPFLSNGLTSYKVGTLNPSGDDNIFFAGFNITARAGVNQPPPPSGDVPEPASVAIWSLLAAAGICIGRRRRRTAT